MLSFYTHAKGCLSPLSQSLFLTQLTFQLRVVFLSGGSVRGGSGLTELILSNNRLGDGGGAEIVGALASDSALETLDLVRTGVGFKTVRALRR